MRTIDCEQGSEEWITARLAKPTASKFSKILTPSGKLSTSCEGYLGELLAEWVTGEPGDDFFDSDWMERGRILEPYAFKQYAFIRGINLKPVTKNQTPQGEGQGNHRHSTRHSEGWVLSSRRTRGRMLTRRTGWRRRIDRVQVPDGKESLDLSVPGRMSEAILVADSGATLGYWSPMVRFRIISPRVALVCP